jgi:hypothetical protein
MPTSPLPSNPSIEHLRKDAKRLRRAAQAGDADALARVHEFHPLSDRALPRLTLADAQLVTARSYGFTSWRDSPRTRQFWNGSDTSVAWTCCITPWMQSSMTEFA